MHGFASSAIRYYPVEPFPTARLSTLKTWKNQNPEKQSTEKWMGPYDGLLIMHTSLICRCQAADPPHLSKKSTTRKQTSYCLQDQESFHYMTPWGPQRTKLRWDTLDNYITVTLCFLCLFLTPNQIHSNLLQHLEYENKLSIMYSNLINNMQYWGPNVSEVHHQTNCWACKELPMSATKRLPWKI